MASEQKGLYFVVYDFYFMREENIYTYCQRQVLLVQNRGRGRERSRLTVTESSFNLVSGVLLDFQQTPTQHLQEVRRNQRERGSLTPSPRRQPWGEAGAGHFLGGRQSSQQVGPHACALSARGQISSGASGKPST